MTPAVLLALLPGLRVVVVARGGAGGLRASSHGLCCAASAGESLFGLAAQSADRTPFLEQPLPVGGCTGTAATSQVTARSFLWGLARNGRRPVLLSFSTSGGVPRRAAPAGPRHRLVCASPTSPRFRDALRRRVGRLLPAFGRAGGRFAFFDGHEDTFLGGRAQGTAVGAPRRRPSRDGGVRMASRTPLGPSSLPYRWLPESPLFHPFLCAEAKACMNVPGWEYGRAPADKSCCPDCTRIEKHTSKSLSGGKVLEFLNSQCKKWRRDYFAPPVPSIVLGSQPRQLPHDRLVDVSGRVVSAVQDMKRRYRCASFVELSHEDALRIQDAEDKGITMDDVDLGSSADAPTFIDAKEESWRKSARRGTSSTPVTGS